MMNMNRRNTSSGGEALLQKLRQVDFAIYDTILYLDAYPNCRKALAHYHTLIEMQKQLKAEYEAKYGPVTALGNVSRDNWDWTSTPWPWEMA